MSTPQFDCLTIADACVDLIVSLGEVLPCFGQVEQWVPDYLLEMGGSACIFACQAAKLGLRTAILGRVGDDAFGQLIVGRMQEAGVDTRYMIIDKSLKTGLGLHLCKPDTDRAMLTYGGSVNAVRPEDVTDAFLSQGRHLHYASHYLQTRLQPVAPEILRRARALELTVSMDTNWDPDGKWEGGLRQMLPQCDLFLPNEQEAQAIAGTQDLDEALRRLLRDVPTVVIKRGADGALVARGEERFAAPVELVAEPADTIGAGDSFDAAFVTAWLRGLPLQRCAEIANACGRATTLQHGGTKGQLWAASVPELAR